jgi:hypothetical protein
MDAQLSKWNLLAGAGTRLMINIFPQQWFKTSPVK